MSRIGSRVAVFLALAAAAALLFAQKSLEEQLPPKPDRYVTDRAGVLGDRAESLNAKLEQFERETSNQILVWIDRKIPENFTLEDFTVRAAQKWKAGQEKADNGAILFVFTDDRKLRIEVGYGLEGVLPDITANRIIQTKSSRGSSSRHAGGSRAAVDGIIASTKVGKGPSRPGRAIPTPRRLETSAELFRPSPAFFFGAPCSRESAGAGGLLGRDGDGRGGFVGGGCRGLRS